MNERIITSNECVAEGVAFLSSADKRLKTMFKKVNSIPLRLRNPGFANLVSAIISQQISVAVVLSLQTDPIGFLLHLLFL